MPSYLSWTDAEYERELAALPQPELLVRKPLAPMRAKREHAPKPTLSRPGGPMDGRRGREEHVPASARSAKALSAMLHRCVASFRYCGPKSTTRGGSMSLPHGLTVPRGVTCARWPEWQAQCLPDDSTAPRAASTALGARSTALGARSAALGARSTALRAALTALAAELTALGEELTAPREESTAPPSEGVSVELLPSVYCASV